MSAAMGVDDPMKDAPEPLRHHCDAIGNDLSLTDQNAEVKEKIPS